MDYTKEKLEDLKHRWVTPKGKKLIKIIKKSRCYLSPVLFREKIHNLSGINDHEIKDDIDLRGAPMAGFDFRIAIQEDDDGYTENIAILSNIHFEGAILKHCTFEDGKIYDCNFNDADLSHAEFQNAKLNNCNFRQADCTGINLHGAKLINCNFTDSDIKDVSLGNTMVDQKTTFGQSLKSEKEESFHFASIEYKQIKEMYKNSSLHNIADLYHYKEMVAKRKIAKKTNPNRWLNYIFGDLLCKYGTSFTRVLLLSATIILLTTTLHVLNNSLYYNSIPVNASFFDALYFSIVTFTTLGYGDYHAIGVMRFVSAAEALMGATLIALFTVIVARKIVRD